MLMYVHMYCIEKWRRKKNRQSYISWVFFLPRIFLWGIFFNINFYFFADFFTLDSSRLTPSLHTYRLTSFTWPCVSDSLWKLYGCTLEYTGQVTFYKVPEKFDHIYLFGLYIEKAACYTFCLSWRRVLTLRPKV